MKVDLMTLGQPPALGPATGRRRGGGGLRRPGRHRGRAQCLPVVRGRGPGRRSRPGHRDRRRLPAQPHGHRPDGLGARRRHRRPIPPRARHPGARARRAPLRRRLRPSRSAAGGVRRRRSRRASAPSGATQPLSFEGEFYHLSLLPAQWSPGPLEVADPPVDVAAVNPYMLRLAGAVADGVHVHPLNHPRYVREVVLPNVSAGAASAGRADPSALHLTVPGLHRRRRHRRGATPAGESWRARRSHSTARRRTTPSSSTCSAPRGRRRASANARRPATSPA